MYLPGGRGPWSTPGRRCRHPSSVHRWSTPWWSARSPARWTRFHPQPSWGLVTSTVSLKHVDRLQLYVWMFTEGPRGCPKCPIMFLRIQTLPREDLVENSLVFTKGSWHLLTGRYAKSQNVNYLTWFEDPRKFQKKWSRRVITSGKVRWSLLTVGSKALSAVGSYLYLRLRSD